MPYLSPVVYVLLSPIITRNVYFWYLFIYFREKECIGEPPIHSFSLKMMYLLTIT